MSSQKPEHIPTFGTFLLQPKAFDLPEGEWGHVPASYLPEGDLGTEYVQPGAVWIYTGRNESPDKELVDTFIAGAPNRETLLINQVSPKVSPAVIATLILQHEGTTLQTNPTLKTTAPDLIKELAKEALEGGRLALKTEFGEITEAEKDRLYHRLETALERLVETGSTSGEIKSEQLLTASPSLYFALREQYNIPSPGFYYALQQALSRGDFNRVEDSRWPTAQLNKGKTTRGRAELRPAEVDPRQELALPPEDLDKMALEMWKAREELSPIDADVLDAVSAIWISKAQGPYDRVVILIDDICRMRGLKPKRGGSGGVGGFRPEQRAQIYNALDRQSTVWIVVEAVVYDKGREERKVLKSRAFVIMDSLGQQCLNGTVDVESVIVTPGSAFGAYLKGPGQQIALMSAKALQYHPDRQAPEKELVHYLSWQWKCGAKEGNFVKTYRVGTLLGESGISNKKQAGRIKERLEKALDQLTTDAVLAGWQYETGWDDDHLPRKNWLRIWLDAKIVVEAPDKIKEHYKDLDQRKDITPKKLLPSLGNKLRAERQARGLSQLVVSERLEITQGYLSNIERGFRPSAKVSKKIAAWLQQ